VSHLFKILVATSNCKGKVYSIENFNAISDRIWNEFEMLITEMKKNDIEIVFFLSPYAPLVYDRIQKNYGYTGHIVPPVPGMLCHLKQM
jgi:hypothetical protein